MIDEGLLSTIPAGCGQLVKMLITLEPNCIFGSNYAYLFIIYCPATGMQNAEHHFGQSRSFSEDAHNS